MLKEIIILGSLVVGSVYCYVDTQIMPYTEEWRQECADRVYEGWDVCKTITPERYNEIIERTAQAVEQREQKQKQEQEQRQEHTVCTIGGTGTTLAKSVVRCSKTMEEVENALQNYSKHSSGAYDSMTWSLGNNVTVTARYIPNLGLQVTAKDGYTTIAENGYVK